MASLACRFIDLISLHDFNRACGVSNSDEKQADMYKTAL